MEEYDSDESDCFFIPSSIASMEDEENEQKIGCNYEQFFNEVENNNGSGREEEQSCKEIWKRQHYLMRR